MSLATTLIAPLPWFACSHELARKKSKVSVVNVEQSIELSNRALKSLEQTGLAVGDESVGARRVLRAAVFTYLAGVSQQLGRFLFFVLLVAMAKGFSPPI